MQAIRTTRCRGASARRLRRAGLLTAVWLAAVAAPSGCSVNPVTGRPQVVLTSAAREVEIGREETAKLEKHVGFVTDAELVRYVEAVGDRVAEHSPRQDVEYHFTIVDMVEPNAFALPGGFVFVTRGLLALVNSEDELAGVIGHEIGHVAARHSVARQSVATPFAIATRLPAAVTGLVLPRVGRVVAGVGELASGLVLSPYSRSQENEADRVGQELSAAAGWDPAALVSFLDTLEREAALHQDQPDRLSFFSSHPRTADRVEKTSRRAAELERQGRTSLAGGHSQFLHRLDGLRVGGSPAEGVFVKSRFLHPDLQLSLTFPTGWETQNARSWVGARDPDGTGLVVLEVAGEGSDLRGIARAFEEKSRARLEQTPRPVQIGPLDALQTVARRRDTRLHLTWISHRDHVFQIAGASHADGFDPYRERFSAVASSFRPLGSAERALILDTRLRVVAAREGERLSDLLKRTGAEWDAEKAAVANALDAEARLTGGQRIKVAVKEPYAG